jgi:hypothetical protein
VAERELVIKISAKNLTEAEFKKVQSGLGGIGKQAGETNTKTGLLSRGFASFGQAAPGALKIVTGAAAATAAAVIGVTAAVVKLGERGAVVGDVQSAFNALSASAGETGDVMLAALSRGVKGTVTNFELMSVANKALGAGLLKTSEDAGTLAEGARLLAKRTGGDTKQAFETLTTAMASGRTAQLKQLGLFVDNKKAVEEYAAAHGKSVGDLNDAERAAALQVATLEALRTELASNAPPLADFGELIARGQVGVKNLVDELAVMISNSPVLLAGMNAAADAISAAFGGESEGLVLGVVNAIERAALFAIQFGKAGITGAELVTRGFAGIKVLVLGVALGLSELDLRMKEVAASALETAASVPGLGAMYAANAESARAAADSSASLNTTLREQIADAAVAAAGNDALGVSLEAGRTILDSVATSMTNAGFSQRSLNQAVAEGNTSVTNMGTSIGTAKFKLEEISPVMVDWQGKLVESGIEAQAWSEIMNSAFVEASAANQSFGASVTGVGDLAAAKSRVVSAAFAAMGLKMQSDMDATVAAMEENYRIIAESGEAKAEQLQKAWEKLEEFRREASEGTAKTTVSMDQQALEGSSQILGQFASKNKAAAISKATIDTILAMQRTFAQLGWPAGLVGMATAAAMGAINVAKIASQDASFREGTPAFDFQSFGAATTAILHGNEAVIPQGRGHMLAGEIASALDRRDRSPDNGEQINELRQMRSDLAELPIAIQRAIRDGMLLAR